MITGRPTCLKFVSATPYMILRSRFTVILLAMSTMDLRFNRVIINGTWFREFVYLITWNQVTVIRIMWYYFCNYLFQCAVWSKTGGFPSFHCVSSHQSNLVTMNLQCYTYLPTYLNTYTSIYQPSIHPFTHLPASLPACLPACLFIYLSLFIYIYIYLSVPPSLRPSVRSSAHFSVRPTASLSVCPSVRRSVCPSVRPSVRRSVCLAVRPVRLFYVRPSGHPPARLSVCLYSSV